MKPVNIENLERILNGIWNGELEHNQSKFFCGTACCLAGWDVALHYPDIHHNREEVFHPAKGYSKEMRDAYKSPWDWSAEHNNLTPVEAELLFDGNTSREIHEATLQAFKQGKRINHRIVPDLFPDDDFVDTYNENNTFIYCTDSLRNKLIEFFKDTNLDPNKIR